MIDRVIKGTIALVGLLIGYGVASSIAVLDILSLDDKGWVKLFFYVGVSLIFGIIFFLLSPRIKNGGRKIIKFIEVELQDVSIYEIIIGTIGFIFGLIIAYLLSQPFYKLQIPYLGVAISIILYVAFGYLGIKIPVRKKEDIMNLFTNLKKNVTKDKTSKKQPFCPKVLDTSVIIDGRIADILKSGFIEGPLVIPEFVLEELQHIADSSDSLKRNRGRKGLDILNRIQKELNIEVIIDDKKFDDIKEVDTKLLKLAQAINGKIITNDYNLNKVAEVQSIEVLNINELANAVKPIVLPGEEMVVQVIKDGKESGQGLAYLDDGTMIVVESGKKHIGETIDVLVTSVLQTSAGRMIFAKPKTLVDKAI